VELSIWFGRSLEWWMEGVGGWDVPVLVICMGGEGYGAGPMAAP
jgi:hypothetical protein